MRQKGGTGFSLCWAVGACGAPLRSRLGWVLLTGAFVAAAAGDAAHDRVASAAFALSRGDAAAFLAAFAPAAPKRIVSDVKALLARDTVESHIEFTNNLEQGGGRALELDWSLDLSERAGVIGLTHRRAHVRCQLSPEGGAWLITSFEPADFFAPPPDMTALWDVFETAAAALNRGQADTFLAILDPAMPGYAQIRDGVNAATGRGEVASSLQLVSNEGSDIARTVVVDWSLAIANQDTSIDTAHKEGRVTCDVEWRKGNWRVIRFSPADFFIVR